MTAAAVVLLIDPVNNHYAEASGDRSQFGWPLDEGRALLKELSDFATQERFVYRHRWQLNDLLVWDNLATMHRATPFDDTRHPRDMRRVTVLERAEA